MPVESAEDLAIYFDPRDFGDEGGAMYAPRDGSAPYPVAGIFDEPASEFLANRWPGHPYQQQEGAGFVITGPHFTCRAADLRNGGKRDDGLTVGGRVWKVSKVLPDGTGVVVLYLTDDSEDDEP